METNTMKAKYAVGQEVRTSKGVSVTGRVMAIKAHCEGQRLYDVKFSTISGLVRVDECEIKATIPRTVGDALLVAFGRGGERVDELMEFPLDSNCGAECLQAIKAGGALLKHVHAATGNDFPERKRAVIDVTIQIVNTYAFG